jgi:hypothetical protein
MAWVDAFLETSNKCATSEAFHYLLIAINIPALSFSEHAFPLGIIGQIDGGYTGSKLIRMLSGSCCGRCCWLKNLVRK